MLPANYLRDCSSADIVHMLSYFHGAKNPFVTTLELVRPPI